MQNLQNNDVPDVEDFDNDASAFTTETVGSDSDRDIFGNPTARPDDKTVVEVANESTQNSVNSQNLLR